VAEGFQQLMLESFFDEEEGKERRAGQARAAAAGGFAATPDARGPTIITGLATVERTGLSTLVAAHNNTGSSSAAGPADTRPVPAK